MKNNERLTYDDVSNTIQIFGRLDFSISKEFDDWFKSLPQGNAINVDFSYCNYIDSTGIGALLNLKAYTDTYGSNVTFLNCNDVVWGILKIAHFHKFIDIKKKR